eukprot:TRINITY_DN4387_c0_g1_i2.p1 TRINITY_DN4387_c0_g1~~TRINITY_DN4387_c0_g1_i2.p1  ORF type:complete len:282 (-),score=54.45 TRINITY_DN4387_c0_g1_i2:3-737(-)
MCIRDRLQTTELTSQISNLNQTISSLQLQNQQSESTQLKIENYKLQNNLKHLDQTQKELNNELSSSLQIKTEFINKNEELQKHVKGIEYALEQEKKVSQSTIQKLKRAIEKVSEDLQKVKNEKLEGQVRYQELEKKNAEQEALLKKKISGLKEQKANFQRQINMIENEKKQEFDQITGNLEQQLQQQEKEFKKNQAEQEQLLQAKNNDYENSEKQRNELQEELNQLNKNQSKLKAKVISYEPKN